MTQSTIIAKYVKSSGVMVTLDIPEEGEIGLPCELKIASMIKKGDKVVAGQTYRWQINISAKGQRSILNVGPAKEEETFKTGKEILQQNIDAKRAEEAATNIAKQNAEVEAKNKEEQAYLNQIVAEKAAKNKKPEKEGIEKIVEETKQRAALSHQEAEQVVHTVAAEIVPQNQSVTVCEASETNTANKYTPEDLLLIRNMAAKNCTEPEFKLLMYLSKTYGLDPLLKQIWAVKRNENQSALIFAGRDGFIAIAHRSGHFDGMKSEVIYETNKDGKKVPVSAWCEVWRNDMSHSFRSEVPFDEYNTGHIVWKTNPSAMIIKVAEAVCLRKAFPIAGIYSQEEINTEK
jgi:phage recombination protein Bet